MTFIYLIVIITIGAYVYDYFYKKKQEKNYIPTNEKEYSSLEEVYLDYGYNYIKPLIETKYIGGIGTISINNNINIDILKEGLLFLYKDYGTLSIVDTETNKLLIKWSDVTNIYIETQRSIQERVNLGKLFVFGILAFGMKGKQKELNKEYVVLDVKNEKDFSIILDCKNTQYALNSLITAKNQNN
ncbi:UNVERIFIED_ORG: hypothetical protein B2H93_14840 [Clostridium botulinum]